MAAIAKVLLLIAGIVLCARGPIDAKVYSKCELAKQLILNGVSRTYYALWVCLAMAESGLNSTKVTQLPNLTANYGIFQINSKEWCRDGRKGGKCNVKCEDLATDSVTGAIQCSQMIQKQKGFDEWKLYEKKCKGKGDIYATYLRKLCQPM